MLPARRPATFPRPCSSLLTFLRCRSSPHGDGNRHWRAEVRESKGRLHAGRINLLGLASTQDGGVGARFRDAVKLDFDSQAQIEKLKGKSLHYEKEFKNSSGPVQFHDDNQLRGRELREAGNGAGRGPMEVGDGIERPQVLSKEVHPAADLGLGVDVSLIEDRGDAADRRGRAGCTLRFKPIPEVGARVLL